MALSYCPAAGGVFVRVYPSMYVRLVDFNMSELLDPPIWTETSAESLKKSLVVTQPSVWVLILCGSVFSAAQYIWILLIQQCRTLDQDKESQGKY